MADSAESTISRPARGRSQKQRASTVSSETENKLARAARSAQRLAQLSDAARDDSTLDLFPDDTARAEQQAQNIDVRQGTLQGFELPDVVLAAAGAPDGVGFTAGPAAAQKAGGRAGTASKTPDTLVDPHSGQMVIDTETPAPASDAGRAAEAGLEATAPASTTSSAAASVARSVAASRQVMPADAGLAARGEGDVVTLADPAESVDANEDAAADAAKSSRRAAEAATASESAAPAASGIGRQRSPSTSAMPATSARASGASTSPDISTMHAEATIHSPRATSSLTPQAVHTSRATPELDQARAAAFADTVDALYGVIADQRRAAGDHSRRMKWLLSIVVCALLMTIAIGIAQTLLLLRLSRQSTAHEQRIEQMMLNQQATLATLLDTDSSTTSLAVSAQAPVQVMPAPAAPPARPADAHPAHAQHAQRRKSAHTH